MQSMLCASLPAYSLACLPSCLRFGIALGLQSDHNFGHRYGAAVAKAALIVHIGPSHAPNSCNMGREGEVRRAMLFDQNHRQIILRRSENARKTSEESKDNEKTKRQSKDNRITCKRQPHQHEGIKIQSKDRPKIKIQTPKIKIQSET